MRIARLACAVVAWLGVGAAATADRMDNIAKCRFIRFLQLHFGAHGL
jgi:hypothetical protein